MKHDTQATIFVRNLTKDTTKEDLAQAFSDIGPVKHAIVIHERHGGPSKGFGFVTFALPADADEALTRAMVIKGKPVKLERASDEKKPMAKESAPEPEAEKEESDREAKDDEEKESEHGQKRKSTAFDWKKLKDEKRQNHAVEEVVRQKSVVLFGVPSDFTEQQLRKRLKKHVGGLVTGINYESDGVVRVIFDDSKHVASAVKELSGREWGGSTVTVRRGIHVFNTTEARSRCRLICRNLGFHVNDEALRTAFGAHGPLQEIVIKRDEKGKSKGFGFVQFYCKSDAQKAVNELNASTDLGPKKPKAPIAVDFALAKDKYEALKQREPSTLDIASEKEESTVVESVTKDSESGESSEDAETSDEEQSEESEDDVEEKQSEYSESDDEQDDSDDADADSSVQRPAVDKGVQEGRTLFVSNLLFETTEEAIRKRFSEFGPVRGIKVIKDASGRSRGLGFVEFWQRDSCDRALATNEITLEGRAVFAKRAVDKNTAQKLRKPSEDEDLTDAQAAKQKKLKADKRHMYLAQEGRVPIDRVPQADRKKRQALEDEKRTKLRSPLFFVSPTRLSIKNLNRKDGEQLDDKDLKALIKKAAIEGIREKIVKDNEGDRSLFPEPGKSYAVKVLKVKVFHEDAEDPSSRSAGFAFVELSQHLHALAALRILNNNPAYAWAAAGGKQAMKLAEDARPRLIVSFAVENASKVRVQKLRAEKSKSAKTAPKEVKTKEAREPIEEEKEKSTKASKENKKVEKQPKARPEKTRASKPEKSPKTRPRASSTGDEDPAKERRKKQKVEEKDISNRAFERKIRKRPETSDQLDAIVAKRSNLFDLPEEAASAKQKRWFEE